MLRKRSSRKIRADQDFAIFLQGLRVTQEQFNSRAKKSGKRKSKP